MTPRPAILAIALAAVVLAASQAALADVCEPRTSRPTATVDASPVATLYVIDELCRIGIDCIGAFWVYMESNGIPGLQRQDAIRDDTCGGRIPGDTVIV